MCLEVVIAHLGVMFHSFLGSSREALRRLGFLSGSLALLSPNATAIADATSHRTAFSEACSAERLVFFLILAKSL